jgi:hypothetical protein
LATGGYETVATSSDAEFTTSVITNEEKYKHSIDSDIKGIIKNIAIHSKSLAMWRRVV